uniref:Putative nitrate reductase NirV n=1 Tax=uncultured bacterium 1114 TaxID=548901 RepID=B8R955_9BACT|nr:putative nitrate reductase NirV [uncultured bacterium 1114]
MIPLLKTFATGVGSALTAIALATAPFPDDMAPASQEPSETAFATDLVMIPAGTFLYRQAGEFTRGGRVVEAPIVTTAVGRLQMMKRQVTVAEYRRCVTDAACPDLADPRQAPERPVTRTSWRDAEAYAAWLSARTGAVWRLPTDEEWVHAAGSRFRDDAIPVAFSADPARRWLARYEKEANEEAATDRQPQPIGHFGANENSILDLAGNVWEWTASCYRRVDLDRGGDGVVNCGIRVIEGRHRGYVPDFIRDPRSGGCAVGKPPANLGFRLIREEGAWPSLRRLVPWLGN